MELKETSSLAGARIDINKKAEVDCWTGKVQCHERQVKSYRKCCICSCQDVETLVKKEISSKTWVLL